MEACPDGFEVLGSGFFGQECVTFLPCRVGRDSCNTCDEENLNCLRCYNARYLLDGQCVEACPDGFDAVGNGNFGRFCEQTPLCQSGRDNCNTCSGDQCVLCYNSKKLFDGECLDECPEGFAETGRGSFGRGCREVLACEPGFNNCNTCSDDNEQCEICYNAKYLLNGTCVDACPSGFDAVGRGNFGRECVIAPPCVQGRDNCNTCSGDQQECLICYNRKYLLNGTCVDACPDRYGEVGNGNFGRQCTFPPCSVGVNNCNTCSDDRLSCEICYNGKKLFNGECVDACPEGFAETGSGNFGRGCREVLPCEAGRDNCNTCSADNEQCELCYNAKRLFNGTCVDECPAGFRQTGSGNFGRGCREALPCEAGLDNCNTCSVDNQRCTICYNGRRLLNGVCVDTCPPGFRETGSGNFGRACVEDTGCNQPQCFSVR